MNKVKKHFSPKVTYSRNKSPAVRRLISLGSIKRKHLSIKNKLPPIPMKRIFSPAFAKKIIWRDLFVLKATVN